MTRIVFMGTPWFAVPSLEALQERHQVVGVVTQPDRPAGRGRKLVASAVKEAALALDLPVIQPARLHTEDALAQLADWQPDLIVVAAFGQLLLPSVLDLPRHGCLNVHASLLPRYRGAAPVAAAILAGDPVTGVTIMRMDAGLDTGPILTRADCAIESGDTTATLTRKLASLGARTLVDVLPGWLAGHVEAQPQDESLATTCQALEKEDGRLDWTRPAIDLERQVRACDPWPGAFTTWQGRRLKVLQAALKAELQGEGEPGQTVDLKPGLGVWTKAGVLELVEVQLAGKKPMAADVFARGQRDLVGGLLGT